MLALNRRFKSSCDQRVPASGRFARGTVLSCDHVGVLPHSTDSSHSLYREVVLTSWGRSMSDRERVTTLTRALEGRAKFVLMQRIESFCSDLSLRT